MYLVEGFVQYERKLYLDDHGGIEVTQIEYAHVHRIVKAHSVCMAKEKFLDHIRTTEGYLKIDGVNVHPVIE